MHSASVPFTITRSELRSKRFVRRKRIAVGTASAFTAIFLLLWYIGVFGGNVRTVDEGQLYRSAQLTGSHLETVLDSKKIKTVLNLRGESSDAEWYRSEVASCDARKIDHVDIALSAVRLPPPEELQKLFVVFDTAKRPLLLHCRGGADRSGLTSVIYKHVYDKMPLDQAIASQLTWRYGHIWFGQAHAMGDFFALYQKDKSGLGLRDWITKKYPAVYAAQPASMKGDAYDVAPKKAASKLKVNARN